MSRAKGRKEQHSGKAAKVDLLRLSRGRASQQVRLIGNIILFLFYIMKETPIEIQPPSYSLLCEPGYYVAKLGFSYQIMRIRRHLNGLVEHGCGWETEAEWISRKPVKIERPTLLDRINCII